MKILNSNQEQQAVSNSINWPERELLAYPEDAPILEQLKSYVPPKKRELTKDEIINIKKYYSLKGNMRRTCRKFGISLDEFKTAVNSLVGE